MQHTVRKLLFSLRVVCKLNHKLDDDTVTAKTVNGFKTKLYGKES